MEEPFGRRACLPFGPFLTSVLAWCVISSKKVARDKAKQVLTTCTMCNDVGGGNSSLGSSTSADSGEMPIHYACKQLAWP